MKEMLCYQGSSDAFFPASFLPKVVSIVSYLKHTLLFYIIY